MKYKLIDKETGKVVYSTPYLQVFKNYFSLGNYRDSCFGRISGSPVNYSYEEVA